MIFFPRRFPADKKSRQSQKVNDYRRYLNTFQSFIGKHSTLVRHVAKFFSVFILVLEKKVKRQKSHKTQTNVRTGVWIGKSGKNERTSLIVHR